jgi:hypothetical protein
MTLPEPVAAMLRPTVEVGEQAQAFVFVTVGVDGLPHVALLSARELAVAPDGALRAAMAAPTTRANLHRTGLATLLAVGGTTAHSVKLRVRRAVETEGLLAAELDVVSHKADSLGIPLSPITFVATEAVARQEHWERTERALAVLAH